jgi:deoxyribose-phosphate aldolase
MTSKIAAMIDHTILKPEATAEAVSKICQEALQYNFATVCVNPCHVPLCHSLLRNSSVKVCTVIGFPLGASATAVKAFETQQAIAAGAGEVDMVINIGALKAGDLQIVEEDIRSVVKAARSVLVKVIIETCLLTESEKIAACRAAEAAGADYVKTSTGFSTSGATVEDVALMRRTVSPRMGVKASGGIRSLNFAKQLIEAGATRLGTSASVKLVQDEAAENG